MIFPLIYRYVTKSFPPSPTKLHKYILVYVLIANKHWNKGSIVYDINFVCYK
jgi:hypothetical protein